MKIENQLCSFEQAQRLRELGVAQIGEFNYLHDKQHLFRTNKNFIPSENEYSAFTVAELGVMLPTETYTIRNTESPFDWEWMDDCNGKAWCGFANEAAARADLLITLLENNLTTAEEVNERLSHS